VNRAERKGEQVFAISSACCRPRRIAATDGLFRFSSQIKDVDPSNHGGVGKNRGWLQPGCSRPFPSSEYQSALPAATIEAIAFAGPGRLRNLERNGPIPRYPLPFAVVANFRFPKKTLNFNFDESVTHLPGTFCYRYPGRTRSRKESVYEGHGFSRAVNCLHPGIVMASFVASSSRNPYSRLSLVGTNPQPAADPVERSRPYK
jgi:hypothetical protein